MIETKKLSKIYGRETETKVPSFMFDLRNERYLRGLSQAKIAHKMGTTASSVARLENGGGRKNHSPSLNTIVNYAQAIGFDLVIKISKIKNKK